MKKSILCILVLVMTVGCLAGCGREKSTRKISTAECDPAPEYVEKCYHENTDERGICLDCGEEVGVALATYNPVEIFDIESDGFGGAWNIRISPKEEYEGCRFENVSILLKGTKRASDGTLDNNQELMSIPLNEKGIGQSSGFLGDVYGTPCWVIGQTAFGIMPRMHYGKNLAMDVADQSMHEQNAGYVIDYSSCEMNKAEDVEVICENEFWKYFSMVDTGLHVEISPSDDYWGCRYTDCQILLQGYLGREFMDLGYADINERGFGRAKWYGLSDEEQKDIQIEKLLVRSGSYNRNKAPMVNLSDRIQNIDEWVPQTEEIAIGKDDFDKYFDLTPAMESDPENGYYLFVITPKEEYKYCEFYNAEITLGYNTDDGLVQQSYEYGPLKLKLDGTEFIELRVNYLTEFTGIEMGSQGKILLK